MGTLIKSSIVISSMVMAITQKIRCNKWIILGSVIFVAKHLVMNFAASFNEQ